jgi:YegS/Rv2252/BmrU family lipid kinase
MPEKTVYTIVNPIAGGGRTGMLIPKLLAELEKRFGSDFIMRTTRQPLEATDITRESILAGAKLVIVMGGDGTVQEAVNGFFKDRKLINPDCELGILNYGTGKGLQQSLDLPLLLENQLDFIADSKANPIDIGCVRYFDEKGRKYERLFINECQLGIGGNVVTGVSMKHKYFGGTIAFGSVAVKEALIYKAINLNVKFDDMQVISGDLIGVVAGNGAFCAGGMRLTPDAVPNDGQFDILLIHDMSILNRIWNFARIYSGKHIKSKYFTLRRSKSLVIDSSEPVLIEADGELLGRIPCEISLLPSVLKVKSNIKTYKNEKVNQVGQES